MSFFPVERLDVRVIGVPSRQSPGRLKPQTEAPRLSSRASHGSHPARPDRKADCDGLKAD